MAAASGSGMRLTSRAPAASAPRARRALDAGDAIGDADHHRRLAHGEAAGDFGDEVFEHALGDEVVGDDAVAQGAHDFDLAGGAAVHLFGGAADFDDDGAVAVFADGDDRRLLEHDAAPLDVDEDVDGPQINCDLWCKE